MELSSYPDCVWCDFCTWGNSRLKCLPFVSNVIFQTKGNLIWAALVCFVCCLFQKQKGIAYTFIVRAIGMKELKEIML